MTKIKIFTLLFILTCFSTGFFGLSGKGNITGTVAKNRYKKLILMK